MRFDRNNDDAAQAEFFAAHGFKFMSREDPRIVFLHEATNTLWEVLSLDDNNCICSDFGGMGGETITPADVPDVLKQILAEAPNL